MGIVNKIIDYTEDRDNTSEPGVSPQYTQEEIEEINRQKEEERREEEEAEAERQRIIQKELDYEREQREEEQKQSDDERKEYWDNKREEEENEKLNDPVEPEDPGSTDETNPWEFLKTMGKDTGELHDSILDSLKNLLLMGTDDEDPFTTAELMAGLSYASGSSYVMFHTNVPEKLPAAISGLIPDSVSAELNI